MKISVNIRGIVGGIRYPYQVKETEKEVRIGSIYKYLLLQEIKSVRSYFLYVRSVHKQTLYESTTVS